MCVGGEGGGDFLLYHTYLMEARNFSHILSYKSQIIRKTRKNKAPRQLEAVR